MSSTRRTANQSLPWRKKQAGQRLSSTHLKTNSENPFIRKRTATSRTQKLPPDEKNSASVFYERGDKLRRPCQHKQTATSRRRQIKGALSLYSVREETNSENPSNTNTDWHQQDTELGCSKKEQRLGRRGQRHHGVSTCVVRSRRVMTLLSRDEQWQVAPTSLRGTNSEPQ
jgi:hypothetical protein